VTRRVATALMGAALLSGCLSPAPDDGGPPREGPLVALDALVPTDDDGPLDAGAVRVACVEAGWAVEGESFEVNTDGCDPGIFVAPLLVNVAPGDTITFTRWHLALDAPPIIYTFTDEAPALATYSLLPIIEAFAGSPGSRSRPATSRSPGASSPTSPSAHRGQRIGDALAELGELA
jgi:hypothetical protein